MVTTMHRLMRMPTTRRRRQSALPPPLPSRQQRRSPLPQQGVRTRSAWFCVLVKVRK